MIVGIPTEVAPGERRVALVPELVPRLVQARLEVLIQPGPGAAAGVADGAYQEKGARLDPEALARADVLRKVQPPTVAEVGRLKEGAVAIGLLAPYSNAEGLRALAARPVTSFAMELMPRITRAQPMDTLSAMSTVAGYKAVLIAANHLPKF